MPRLMEKLLRKLEFEHKDNRVRLMISTWVLPRTAMKEISDEDLTITADLQWREQVSGRHIDPWWQMFPIREDQLPGGKISYRSTPYREEILNGETPASLFRWFSLRMSNIDDVIREEKKEVLITEPLPLFTTNQFATWCLYCKEEGMHRVWSTAGAPSGKLFDGVGDRIGGLLEAWRLWNITREPRLEEMFTLPVPPDDSVEPDPRHYFQLLRSKK